MDSIFVDETPIEICIDPPGTPEELRNVVYIRPEMSYFQEQRVIGLAAKLLTGGEKSTNGKAKTNGKVHSPGEWEDMPEEDAPKNTLEFNVGTYSIALLVENITGWRGPIFRGLPCTHQNKARLKGKNHPLVKAVLDAIGERNRTEDTEALTAGQDEEGPAVIEGEYTEGRPQAASPNLQIVGSEGSKAG